MSATVRYAFHDLKQSLLAFRFIRSKRYMFTSFYIELIRQYVQFTVPLLKKNKRTAYMI